MIHIALIGCGKMALWHAEELGKIPDVKVIALVDPVPARTAEIRKRFFPKAQEFTSMESLLDDKRIRLDAVNIVTPHTLHFPQAKAALDHGLHVLIEKPMVTNSRDAYELWRAVQSTGKVLAITYQAPYTEEFAYIAHLRDTGALGKVQLISGWVSQNWLQGTANTWRQDPALSGGGQMFDTGAHLFNAVMWIMNDPVIEAACFYDKCSSPVDINGIAIAKFQNGALGDFSIGGNCPAFHTEIQIQTDRFLILTDQYGKKLEILDPDGKQVDRPVKHDGHAPTTPHRNFINAIKGREPVRAGVRYGVLLTALMDALYESADHHRVVQIEPVPVDIGV
jgi:predicted dehydrogenase